MATLFISEYVSGGFDASGKPMPVGKEPSVAEQAVSFTTVQASSPFNDRTSLVRLQADAKAHIRFGSNPDDATTSDKYLTANQPEYFAVKPGHKVSVVQGA